MLKNLIITCLLFVPICPAYAEELTALIAPKSKDTSVCGNSTDPANSSTMCHLPNEGTRESSINQAAKETEIYIPAEQPLYKEVVLELEEDLPVRKTKRKKKIARNKKTRVKKKLKVESDENEEPVPGPAHYPVPMVTKTEAKLVKNELPQVAPAGTTVRTFEYTVREGDTLNTIIQQHFSETIQPGQKIIVVAQPIEPKSEATAVPKTEPAPAPAPKTIEYTVQQGDTLSSILRKYFNGNIYGKRARLERLLELNKDIKEADTIRLGQKINIPASNEGGENIFAPIAAKSETENSVDAGQREKKLAFYFNYRFNFISVTDSVSGINYNFNTDYDFEGGIDYSFRISPKNTLRAGVGFSEHSMPRSVMATLIIIEPTRKTQGSANVGISHELTEDNILSLILKYRPYFFLTNQKLEYLPAPALSLYYENQVYQENQTMLGFGLAGEAIAKQDYPQFKSETGSALSVNFIYQQEFVAKDWVTIEFLFQQRKQGSTFYKMNDKNAGFRFTYTLNL